MLRWTGTCLADVGRRNAIVGRPSCILASVLTLKCNFRWRIKIYTTVRPFVFSTNIVTILRLSSRL
jgi:hypothetical protein